MPKQKLVRGASILGGILASSVALAHGCSSGGGGQTSVAFEEVDLVSDVAGRAANTDANLVNPWGLAFGPSTFFWVANNVSETSTVYDANGVGQPTAHPLVVDVPGDPTGTVYNGTNGFVIASGGSSGPARFLFAGMDGSIRGWNPDVAATESVVAVEPSAGEVYTGLAIGPAGALGTVLYVANFSQAKVEVLDSSFADVDLGAGAFVDPNLPSGYSPFNVVTAGGNVWVAYAKQGAQPDEEEHGPGLGFVSEFGPDGTFMRRFASQGDLNAPWGIAVAPAGFGDVGGAVLIGNFGDGRIHAFDASSGASLGALVDAAGSPIAIDGLWSIVFGNGAMAGDPNVLYFTAGTDDETHGLFGAIRVAQ